MKRHDLVIIGGGPGGYVAAIRAAQLGFDVAVVDENDRLGGTCLRVGCIPSKALLEASYRYYEAKHHLKAFGVKPGRVTLDLAAMMKHKDAVVEANTAGIAYLFKKNKITWYQGRGRLLDAGRLEVRGPSGTETLAADDIVIATGSVPARLKGVEYDGEVIGTSTEALAYEKVPERLVVIGAGYIGLELGSVWARLGARVTVLEYLDRVLPGMDSELGRKAQRLFEKQGLEFRLGTKVLGARVEKGRAVVEVEGAEPITADRVLVAVGRAPNTQGLGLEEVGVETDARGFIVVDEHFQTSVPGIHAIGDVIGGAMLAHKASAEGIALVEYLANGYGAVNYDVIPAAVFTHPEIASVGKTEDELKEAGVPYTKGVFPFQASGRARAMNDTEGFVKVLAHKETDRVLGVHAMGPAAGELIHEAAVAMEFGASAEDLARIIHVHPTLSEAVKEAAEVAVGHPIHI